MPIALINLGNTAIWSLLSNHSAALQLARWPICAAIVLIPFLVMGRKLSAGVAPRTYRYAAS